MPPLLCHPAVQREPPGASAPTFLMGGVVPAWAPLAPVAPCRAPPAPHLEVVPRAEEEAAVLCGAGLADDAGDLVAPEGGPAGASPGVGAAQGMRGGTLPSPSHVGTLPFPLPSSLSEEGHGGSCSRRAQDALQGPAPQPCPA